MEKAREKIQHPFHIHPLALVEDEQSNQKEKAYCSGCGEVVSSGSCFSCVECCNYHLHKECAHAPYKIPKHPLHLEFHQPAPFSLLESPRARSGYACALCKEKRNMFFYECDYCYFALDIKCALLSLKVGESIYGVKDDGHQLPFIFLENHKDQLKKVDCSCCHQSLIDSIYVSVECKLYLHKKCFSQFTEIDHPCHRLHTLVLQFGESNCFCEVCQKEDHHNFFYRCFACKFDIHLKCIWPRPIIEANRYHEHPFTLLYRSDLFICDACGTNGKFVSYVCLTCHLHVHKNCTSLPLKIKVSRHDHVVVHKYFFKKRELEEHECKICFEEVKTEYGSYHCWREDCNYIVHVKCATEDDRLYYIIDQENQDEEPVVSSISCVVEVNEHGEAVKIFKHFKHEHNLVFEDKIKEDSDRHCDGCMLSISTPFYYCSVCNFFLHKTCAELPKIKHHWYRRFPFTLEARDFLRCKLCYRYCSGLFYISGRLYFCLRCATVPDIIRREGHEHLLFFDYQRKRQCSACGVGGGYGAFRCKECSFSLDFACMTLPQAIQHKCDSHLLKLTYHGENADAEQHYCDVCEEKQNPNHWYYYCSTCDNSVHPKCVLGEYPFLKDGITWRSVVLSTQRSGVFHEHSDDVIFVHKVDGYPECAACGKLCQDEALKCPKCNIIVHHKCRWDRKW